MIYRDDMVGTVSQTAPTNHLEPPLQKVYVVVQEEGLIHGDAKLKKYITTYYKKLFGPSHHNNL